ncbi:unnamed protein product [Nippostrongylus brasiliensis]|uniref:Retrotransposon gag protein n=1 Tax=Nippostrongylus brasiliensis TaxID=27835 RepID=A0A0N4YT48_NIPBR|nr:unnamed protein product [Nippostrongylus brasiliensis]
MRLEDKECDLRASMTSTDTKKLSVSKQEKAIMHEFEVHVKDGLEGYALGKNTKTAPEIFYLERSELKAEQEDMNI